MLIHTLKNNFPTLLKNNFHFSQKNVEWASHPKNRELITTWRLMTYKVLPIAPSVTLPCIRQIDSWQIPSNLSITTPDSNRSRSNMQANNRLIQEPLIMLFKMLLWNKLIPPICLKKSISQKIDRILPNRTLYITKTNIRNNLLIMNRTTVPLFKDHLRSNRCSLMGMIRKIRFSQDS